MHRIDDPNARGNAIRACDNTYYAWMATRHETRTAKPELRTEKRRVEQRALNAYRHARARLFAIWPSA